MCGLCGVLSPELDKAEAEIFKSLMIVSTLRGELGAGIAAVPVKYHNSKEIFIRRTLETAAALVCSDDYDKLVKKKLSCLMGHARLPTTGDLSITSVHPHVHGSIIGMHNGTMTYVNDTFVGVDDNDSMLIFENIFRNGIDATIEKSQGAYALTYIDKRTRLLYMLRNIDRPLYIATLDSRPRTIFWGSETVLLYTAISRVLKNEKIHFSSIPANTLVRYKLNPEAGTPYLDRREVQSRPFFSPITTAHSVPTSSQTPPPVSTSPPQTVPKISATLPQSDHEKPTVFYHTFRGAKKTYEDLCVILNSGCSWCSGPSSFSDYMQDRLSWFGPDEFICHECLAHDEEARLYAIGYGVPEHDLPPLRKLQ